MPKQKYLARFVVALEAKPLLEARNILWSLELDHLLVVVQHESTHEEEIVEQSLQFFGGIPATLTSLVVADGEQWKDVRLPVLPRRLKLSQGINIIMGQGQNGHPKIREDLMPGETFLLRNDEHPHDFAIWAECKEKTCCVVKVPGMPPQVCWLRQGSQTVAWGLLPPHQIVTVMTHKTSQPITLAGNVVRCESPKKQS